MKRLLVLAILLFQFLPDCPAQTTNSVIIFEDIASLPELCPPTNLGISVNDDCILLDFEIEGTNCGTFIGINVYINGEFIGTFEDEYEICEITPGYYNLYITALYEEGESEPSNMINFEMIGDFPFFDDFENYNPGQQLACQNPNDWTTLNYLPCTYQDPFITDSIAYSGTLSIILVDSNDLVKTLNDLTTGRYKISFKMFIPEGSYGYFTTLQKFEGYNSLWGMQVFFNEDGNGLIVCPSAIPFHYNYNTWNNNDIIIDLDHDIAKYFHNNVFIEEWCWSYGGGWAGINQLAGSEFYPWTSVQQGTGKYYIDDYQIEQLAPLMVEPPENLQVNPLNEDLILTWSSPYDGIWLQYDNGNFGNGINAGGAPIYIAARFSPEDIEDLDGMFLTAIKFFAQNNDCIYSLRVWTGENATNTILEQDVLNFIPYSWNIVELNNPVLLDVSEELWIGNVCSSINYWDFYAACDDGPAISNKGDMFSIDGINWESMSIGYGLNYNWNIRGLIQENTDLVEIEASGSQITSPNKYKDNPINSKSFLGYNIYSSINEGSFEMLDFTEDTSYIYPDPLPGKLYSFYVTSIYDEGESTPSDTVSILISGNKEVINSELEIKIFPNPVGQQLFINSDAEMNRITVYDITGRTVLTNDNLKTFEFILDTEVLKSGLCFINVKTSGQPFIKRFVRK
ncbi:MAG: T9SS type A sorting domain-containing protein [Bacteroidales bacterium]|nr:T9SS type A sorting domain-containing protein [Bacteroidales bacterium]